MKIDNEQDRQVLLGLTQNAQISGSAVLVIADLVRRIQTADIEQTGEERVAEDPAKE